MIIILGSSSPRRHYFFSLLFDEFQQITPEIDEAPFPDETALDYALRISSEKASWITKERVTSDNFFVVTADTVVSLDNKILGKPKNRAKAENMLTRLSGQRHEVITSISIARPAQGSLKIASDYDVTEVIFKKLSNSVINRYLDSIDWHDKAGSYAIQEHPELIISSVNGSISNVVGFPVRVFLKYCALKTPEIFK
ncbi:MAG: septum formation protein Maf [Spirochaetes bacterium]|nr:septum formation protein Maf [Spirochaetota bacterium]MBN2771485.1 septum formation protein Maf [Spirochaetota bacterium]